MHLLLSLVPRLIFESIYGGEAGPGPQHARFSRVGVGGQLVRRAAPNKRGQTLLCSLHSSGLERSDRKEGRPGTRGSERSGEATCTRALPAKITTNSEGAELQLQQRAPSRQWTLKNLASTSGGEQSYSLVRRRRPILPASREP